MGKEPKILTVNLAPDHLQGICKKAKPLEAIEELIWNALDADATEVSIGFNYNAMGGLNKITVVDNGVGFTPAQCQDAFESLGGSSKKRIKRTSKDRTVHGKEGQGRIKAFKIGGHVEWTSRYAVDKTVRTFTVSGDYSSLRNFSMTDDTVVSSKDQHTGVKVTICKIKDNFGVVFGQSAVEKLTSKFALYLLKYRDISIIYDGKSISPNDHLERTKTIQVTINVDGNEIQADIDIIEWKGKTQRAIYLCDDNGFAYEEVEPKIQAPGFQFTAHLRSDEIKDLYSNGNFWSSDLDSKNKVIFDPIKDVLRNYFRERENENVKDIVSQWRNENIYPYKNEDVESPVEKVERQVFNLCAIRVHDYIPGFDKTETDNKRIMFRLLKEALATNPHSLQKILIEVLNLNKEAQNEFATILERTKLSAVISATRLILDRLDFLDSLEPLLYGKYQKTLKERTQLQNILTEELWVFGEQYALGCTEKNLKNVLKAHIKLLERNDLIGDDETVTDTDGNERRFDIMLNKTYSGSPSHFHHLVVELKRPLLVIGQTELNQISNYAHTISRDDRFDKENTTWDFYLLGTSINDLVTNVVNQSGRDPGHYFVSQDKKVNIFVKTWASIIQDARWRYQFYKEKIQLETLEIDKSNGECEGLSYLQKKFSHLLPPEVT